MSDSNPTPQPVANPASTPVTTPATPTPPCRAGLWRIATICALIALALLGATAWSLTEQFQAQIAHLQKKLKQTPQVQYLALLLDAQHAPAQLLTWDAQDGVLTVQRLNSVMEGREDSLQLWALDEAQHPLSLGVLPTKVQITQLRVSADVMGQVRSLAISVEERGGTPADKGPRLPYLTQGQLIRKAI